MAGAELVLPLPGCLNLEKLLSFSMLQFPPLQNRDSDKQLARMWGRLAVVSKKPKDRGP